MNTVANWIADRAGLAKVWAFMDGKKTYAAAALGMLTSLVGLGAEVGPILAAHDTMGIWGFIQRLPTDPSWLSLMASFGLLGLGHGVKKAADTTVSVTVDSPPPPAA